VLHPGDIFDRYTIEALLGEGGMGRVYRAHDPRLHRKVALKVLSVQEPEASACSAQEARRFGSEGSVRMLREARAAAALDHPNAVAIFDVGEVDGITFIAMELIEGRTLRTFVGTAGVAWDRRLRWLADVARALSAAHKRGLVHRDIKPENVMVRDDGVVKVLDFGIARGRDAPVDPIGATQRLGLEQLTSKGIVVGTPRYMSPEQLCGEDLDGRSDQFAWAVLAYELLTGKAPWREAGDSLASVAVQLMRDPEPLHLDGLPEVVKAAILRALSRDKEARFPSMDALLRVLEPFVAGSTGDLLVESSTSTSPMRSPH
jgi:serine/threonine-protein kinase